MKVLKISSELTISAPHYILFREIFKEKLLIFGVW